MLFITGFVVGWLLMAMFGDWVWWRDLLVGYIVGIAAVLVLSRHLDERGEESAWWLITAALAALYCCGSRRNRREAHLSPVRERAQALARRLSYPPRAHR